MLKNIVFTLIGILIFFFVLFNFEVAARENPNKNPEESISLELISTLAFHPQWLALGHYSETGLQVWRSSIADQHYFVAEDGQLNPTSELKQTLSLFLLDDQSPSKCRYIARYKWLKKELRAYNIILPGLVCDEYDKWVQNLNNPEKLILVFPAAYINAPASMFGHTLLRFESYGSDGESNNYLLSMSVNFAANVPKDTGAVSYIVNGLAGGFYGQYSVIPYYENIRTYNRIENRDIWEYTLNLSSDEIQRIIDHLWELNEVNFEYYFLKQNCSYRLLELLEVARPQYDLTEEFSFVAIPADTVRKVIDIEFVENKYYRPSEARRLVDLQKKLNSTELEIVRRLTLPEYPVIDEQINTIDIKKKSELITVAHKLIQYKINESNLNSAELQNRAYELVLQLKTLPPPDFSEEESDIVSPDTGHETSRLGVLYGRRKGEDYFGINYRIAIHDNLDLSYAYEKGAEIALFDLSLNFDRYDIYFDRLDLFRIRSLTASNEFFKPIAWSAQVSIYRDYVFPAEKIAGIFDIGVGKNFGILDSLSIYSLFTTSIETNPNYQESVDGSLGGWVGMLWQGGVGAGEIEFRGKYYILNEIDRYYVSLAQQFDIKMNHAIRIKGECGWVEGLQECDVGVNYFYYF